MVPRIHQLLQTFLKDFSGITLPLTRLTSLKLPFQWDPSAVEAIWTLKERFSTTPILIQSDLLEPFMVEVDVSDVGVGRSSPSSPVVT